MSDTLSEVVRVSIPVVANGDIVDIIRGVNHEVYGLCGLMIGRGAPATRGYLSKYNSICVVRHRLLLMRWSASECYWATFMTFGFLSERQGCARSV